MSVPGTAADDVSKLLTDSGVSVDKASLDVMIKKLSGKSLPALVAEGSGMMASMPAGGAAAAAPAAGGAPAAEEKVEEKKKEEEPEEDVDMGGIFGDDDDY